MTQLRIEGLDVDFPFEPYPAQVEYMESVIRALDGGVNALLESPTGTGKTLCLLCACLAWVRRARSGLAPGRVPLPGTTLFSGASETSGPSAVQVTPKIVYCSRTHAQLAQVARELKRTAYTDDITMALLGSREHMCVNSEVARLPTTQAQHRMCSALRLEKNCRFFRGLQHKRGALLSEETRVHDMEDLVLEGRRSGFCPYFHEREVSESADIILMPYNYVLDPALRQQLPFPMDNAILVVDEAHNLPGVLSAAGCFNLLPVDLATAIHDCVRAVAALRLQDPSSANGPGTNTTSPNATTAIEEQELASLKLVLCQLESAIATEPMSVDSQTDRKNGPPKTTQTPALLRTTGNDGVATELVRPGACIVSFLERALITREMYDGSPGHTGMSDALSRAITLLAETESPAAGLPRVQQFLSAVFQHDPSDYGSARFVLQEQSADRKHGEMHRTSAVASSSRLVPHSNAPPTPTPRRSLGFWVLDNSTNLEGLSHSTRCLLLTSGTLSPLDHFAAELGVDFPIRLSGQHVVDAEKQVYGSVLCKGPGGEKLNSSYAFRHSGHYREGLGMTLTNLCRVTPGGVLVFFPSYSALHSTIDMWKTGGTMGSGGSAEQGDTRAAARTLWGMLSEIKPVFVEPKDTAELKTVVQTFQKTVDDAPRRGAVLLAVCRGKVSEGVDFADQHGRCVVVTGIPFANQTDLFVRVKKAYLSEVAPMRPRVGGRLFTGDDWYCNEAMRAVNQCVGRVIRHKDDYGSVVLADERFSSHLKALSPWIAARTRVCTEFRECFAALNSFFAAYRRRPREVLPGDDERPSVNLGNPVSSSATALAPATAGLAKQYAAEQARQRLAEESERVRRRLEEATERPATTHQHSRTSCGESTPAGPDAQNASASSLSPSPAHALRMTRQTLVPITALPSEGATVVTTGFALTGPQIGSSSREFCQYLKQHVSVDSYERFKVLLRQIASYRTRLQDTLDASQRDFTLAVQALRALFREADPVYDAVVAEAFGNHIPPELQTLYKQLLRQTP